MLRSLVLLLAALPAFAADPATGTWKVDGDVAGNPISENCTLKLEPDNKLSGSCVAPKGTVPVTGSVDGQKVTFTHGGEYEGTALTITFTGVVGSDGAMKGSIMVAPFDASGDFTAKKSN